MGSSTTLAFINNFLILSMSKKEINRKYIKCLISYLTRHFRAFSSTLKG